jgi:hypothetical protein
MKLNIHCRTMAVAAIILLTLTFTVLGASTVQQPANTPVVLRAERGDTYLNLFGNDWEKAFRQNRITVVRGRRPLVSPDILVQGQILQVTGDTFLTARALQRARSIAARRDALQHRLSAFASREGDVGRKAIALRSALDDLRYVADLDYIERETDRLNSTTPIPAPRPTLWIPLALAALLACVILGGLVLRRRRAQGPTGDERVQAALHDLPQVVH